MYIIYNKRSELSQLDCGTGGLAGSKRETRVQRARPTPRSRVFTLVRASPSCITLVLSISQHRNLCEGNIMTIFLCGTRLKGIIAVEFITRSNTLQAQEDDHWFFIPPVENQISESFFATLLKTQLKQKASY